MKIDVIRRPNICPKCGGAVCDIIYGMPVATWEEDHFKATGHRALLGGCCMTGDDPDYECEDCGLQFKHLSFPRNSKSLALAALTKNCNNLSCDVQYEGLYRKQMVYCPILKQGICWEGIIRIFVDSIGKVIVRSGVCLLSVIKKIQKDKERFVKHDEHFYWLAAKRAIKDEEYYGTVIKCGIYNGKRAYRPIFKTKYKKNLAIIGLALVVLVDDKGKSELFRSLSFGIYDEIRKNS